MASPAEIRAAIVARLAAVPDAGRVHAFERFAATEAAFRALYTEGAVSPARLLGWHVRRVARRQTRDNGLRVLETTWAITGMMALADAAQSELVFDTLVEAVCDALDASPLLPGVLAQDAAGQRFGAQIETMEPVMFCGVLCHRAALSLTTVHRVAR